MCGQGIPRLWARIKRGSVLNSHFYLEARKSHLSCEKGNHQDALHDFFAESLRRIEVDN